MQAPEDILDSGTLPNELADARLIAAYSDAGHSTEDLIYLSLGETWTCPPPALVKALCRVPAYAHGYTLSPYGLPALRKVLCQYVIRTHELEDIDRRNFDVAVSQCGTRAAMSDFGQLVRDRGARPHVALAPAPGWDYAGVLAPLGFAVRTYHLTADRAWQPDPRLCRRHTKGQPTYHPSGPQPAAQSHWIRLGAVSGDTHGACRCRAQHGDTSRRRLLCRIHARHTTHQHPAHPPGRSTSPGAPLAGGANVGQTVPLQRLGHRRTHGATPGHSRNSPGSRTDAPTVRLCHFRRRWHPG